MGYEPKDGGDELLVNSGLVPIEMAGQIFHQTAAAMNKTERMRYARAILLAQDKNRACFFAKIRAELKRVGKELGESYALNQTSLQFPDLQQKHKEWQDKILNDLVS